MVSSDSRKRWADSIEMDVDDDIISTVATESDIQVEVQPLPCSPHYYPDPSRRSIKEGDIMYFIRAPPCLDSWNEKGYAVTGLDKADSLKCVCDVPEFDRRFEELYEVKAQAKESQDPDMEALTTNVKKRKLNSDGKSQNTTVTETENIAPRSKKSGSAKRAAPHVQQKKDQAVSFLSFFELPTNPYIEFNALAVVIKNLRGDLRSRISNAKKPKGFYDDAKVAEIRLSSAAGEVAKYLVNYYNHPASSLDRLIQLVNTTGCECIRKIQEWLDIKELCELNAQAVERIYFEFRRTVTDLVQDVEKETRLYVTKSQHKLSCTKVRVDANSPLLGQYSGPPDFVSAQLKSKDPIQAEKARHQPYLCKDLRAKKGINILAFLDKNLNFHAMPGPCDAFPEGDIFFGCEICQGKTSRADCSCTEWLEDLGITQYETFEFDLDQMVVPAHLDNYCFGGRRWGGSQGVLDLRRFTADENGEGGVQLVGLNPESKDGK
eukprot:gnl/MRDRNA2_/MRDRNA2_109261_c0_seq1.p1 gnl/MRDRNA2_/MRDRNA2_109261_c0~~gnl/MRDRNA2_/MRDRNA2_109261_c0_seq1.p1  ORF type:complete len:491 (+),score=80.12 gnl/MRDRNA2_/MRDRNA2_109261_c0_seq1:109-1581(+)